MEGRIFLVTISIKHCSMGLRELRRWTKETTSCHGVRVNYKLIYIERPVNSMCNRFLDPYESMYPFYKLSFGKKSVTYISRNH